MNFVNDPAFYTALVSIVFILGAWFFPGLREVLDQLSEPVTALILALIGRSAAVQFAAFQQNVWRNQSTGAWEKLPEQNQPHV